MDFYIPLGARGFVLRFGTFVIAIFGGMAYRRAARRRQMTLTDPPLSIALAEILAME